MESDIVVAVGFPVGEKQPSVIARRLDGRHIIVGFRLVCVCVCVCDTKLRKHKQRRMVLSAKREVRSMVFIRVFAGYCS